MEIDELVDTTAQLGMHYRGWKASEKEKNRFKDEFFALATSRCKASARAEKLVFVDTADEAKMKQRVKRDHPAWMIVDFRLADEGFEVIIEEDPALMKFSFVNPGDGYVYSRGISAGDTLLDEEGLTEKRPDLAKRILVKLPWGAVVTRPLATLDSETLAELGKFIYQAPPKVKLSAPRKATEEELAAVDG